MTAPEDTAGGVYYLEPGGTRRRVHTYQGGDYGLEDVAGLLGLGRLEAGPEADWTVLVLSAHELRQLKVAADAYSFDYEEEFIEMCHALCHAAAPEAGSEVRFAADF